MEVQSTNEPIELKPITDKNILLSIKREDTLHPIISGNKLRKLKYNLLQAKQQGCKTVLTFGGAFSNHIAATAHAGKIHGFHTVGVIRGEELVDRWKENPTLGQAAKDGMRFKFLSREDYRKKSHKAMHQELERDFGLFYLLPEGGTNELAVKGCEEILAPGDTKFDFICCPVGTGGTLAGIINSANPGQRVLGFPALKGGFLTEDICKFAQKDNWELVNDYHFGGYAKVDVGLVEFMNNFFSETQIPLDPIYTGKMMFGIIDLIKKDFFPSNTKILAIHTGGLQGIKGMNAKLKLKNISLLRI
ncbi:1-aminocyclopropane-1-carboxylate deaminase/D-cysteine desulfhydrase [Pareuzebyella sediminis]|uniref:1-aminocyclopropane-1-carboxylate deaminase/D-cysteine desulfhydrase n=1 Tax=Pareuzebyella sediminis TaxID=2607998 RepID=UPI0011F0167D|nr:pyridoxal-phosphate dependent enzyme [Pareuzebyella sediminis]